MKKSDLYALSHLIAGAINSTHNDRNPNQKAHTIAMLRASLIIIDEQTNKMAPASPQTSRLVEQRIKALLQDVEGNVIV